MRIAHTVFRGTRMAVSQLMRPQLAQSSIRGALQAVCCSRDASRSEPLPPARRQRDTENGQGWNRTRLDLNVVDITRFRDMFESGAAFRDF